MPFQPGHWDEGIGTSTSLLVVASRLNKRLQHSTFDRSTSRSPTSPRMERMPRRKKFASRSVSLSAEQEASTRLSALMGLWTSHPRPGSSSKRRKSLASCTKALRSSWKSRMRRKKRSDCARLGSNFDVSVNEIVMSHLAHYRESEMHASICPSRLNMP